jgi:DNA polymerase elongation subunit (family B)
LHESKVGCADLFLLQQNETMTTGNYVGAVFSYDDDSVLVWERSDPAQRVLRRYKAPRYFYVPAEDGQYTSIFGDKLARIDCDDVDEWNMLLRQYPRDRHESDIQPLFKVLMNEYYKKPLPILNFAFIDIETDVKKSIGWSTIANPYAAINAVTIYQSWTDKHITLLVPPKGYDVSKFDAEIHEVMKDLQMGFEPEWVLCKSEVELLMKMLSLIDNADIISGWNSEFFDIPYIMKRLERVLPKHAARMSFTGARAPKASTVMRFGEESIVYKLFGRCHLDYLDLFKKFAQDVRYPTYSLGFVGEAEVGAPKVSFDGHFEEFYNTQFARFAAYNARDVNILVKINAKRKLIQLVNTMAHENTCLFENLLGTVRYVETAIVNRAHHVHNQIVRDKVGLTSDGEVVDGALVLDTVAGLWEWLGSVDINSLYPSVIRALNISPEMIIGQFVSGVCRQELKENGLRFAPENNKQLPAWKQALVSHNFDRKHPNRPPDIGGPTDGEYDWAGIIEGDDLEHTLHLGEVGKKVLKTDEDYLTFTGKEWLVIMASQNWAISAYGTVFDQSRGLGIIAASLEAWYAERKALQAEKKKWQLEVKRLEKEGGTPEEIAAAELKVEDFELMQMSKKLTLNSTYGAMLSPHFGLGRKEMGASVTACGRAITNFMITQIAEKITGKKAEVTWYYGPSKKLNKDDDESFNSKRSACFLVDDQKICDVTLLSDTDSCYFRTLATTKAEAVKRADEIAAFVNDSFPGFMRRTFRCTSSKYDSLIKAGREIVGRRGLFLNAKKKYTIRVIDLEGLEVFKLKMMGSELKKVDTPKVIQDFLKGLLALVLDGDTELAHRVESKELTPAQAVDLVREATEDDLEKYVNKNRRGLVFKVENPIVLGAAKGINNLDNYYDEWQRTEKVNLGKCKLPGHVRAAINYNELAKHFEGTGAKLLKSGDKGLIFYLKPNEFNIKSIAIPVDFEHFPKWFDENFQLDLGLTEEKMIDSKIEGTFEALGFEIPNPQRTLSKKIFSF